MTENERSENPTLDVIEVEIDAELALVELSADPVDADEPVRGPYETRLLNLRSAVVRVQDLESPHA